MGPIAHAHAGQALRVPALGSSSGLTFAGAFVAAGDGTGTGGASSPACVRPPLHPPAALHAPHAMIVRTRARTRRTRPRYTIHAARTLRVRSGHARARLPPPLHDLRVVVVVVVRLRAGARG